MPGRFLALSRWLSSRRADYELLRRYGLRVVAGGSPASHVQVAPDSTGKDVDADSLTSTEAGTPTVYRQNVVVSDPTTYAAKGAVANAAAAGTEYGQIVRLASAQPDTTTGSTALGALNAAISVSLAGQAGAAFQLQSGGTLIGTITPELSFDGGTSWFATFFDLPLTSQKVATATVASAQATTAWSVVAAAGASHARVRVSAYTSGTANFLARASDVNDPSTLHAGPVATAMPPTIGAIGGKDGSSNLQAVQVFNAIPASTDYGLLSRIVSDPPDKASAATAMNALNAAISLALSGYRGAGMQLDAGTFNGTVLPELSFDGGTSWVSTYFHDSKSNTLVGSLSAGGSNALVFYGILLTGGATHVRIRCSVFTAGTANVTVRLTQAAIQASSSAIAAAPAFYSGTLTNFAPTATSPTDILVLNGVSGKDAYFTRLTFSGFVTTAVMLSLSLIKRSSQDTLGTAGTAPSLYPYDSGNNPTTPTSTMTSYTANPTLGTTAGTMWTDKYLAQLNTVVPMKIDVTFASPIRVQNGAAICLNLNSTTIAGPSFNIGFHWYEA